jgi:hypothetical protein
MLYPHAVVNTTTAPAQVLRNIHTCSRDCDVTAHDAVKSSTKALAQTLRFQAVVERAHTLPSER